LNAPGSVWEGRSYAPQASHHRSLDDWFLDRCRPAPDHVVVDAGCGTGEFTARIADLVPDGRAIGVDPDPSMLDGARVHVRPNLEFRAGSVQALDEVCELESADLVVSRAVLHWIAPEELPRCYAAIHGVLRPGGWMHTESAGTGNVRAVVALMDAVAAEHGLPSAQVWFSDAGATMELLERAGLELGEESVTTVAQRRAFDRDQLLGFVRTQASVAYVPGAEPAVRDAFLAGVEARLDELRRHDGTFDQTFVRLHVLARRPS
jgi:trans-aconitate methyltransferase